MDRKIYRIGDCAAEDAGTHDEHGEDEAPVILSAPLAVDDIADPSEQWDDTNDSISSISRDGLTLGAGVICGLLAMAWTGIYLWANYAQLSAGLNVQDVTAILTGWSGPMVILLLIYTQISRRRRADARYFEQQVISISEASHRLDERLRATNTELSMAREFLGHQATQLDSLGRTAIERLSERAETVRSMIDGSDQSMQSIADVSAIAEKNLETLRKHMPVMITSAKDMANQIGNAGRTAQVQVRDMIAGMQKINEFGNASNAQIGVLEGRVSEAIKQWESHIETLGEITARSTSALVTTSTDAAAKLSEQEQASIVHLEQFESRFSEHLDAAGAKLEQNIHDYAEAINSMATQRAAESDAIAAIIAQMGEQLSNIRTDMASLDNDTADQTAKMAFAVTALNNEMASVNATLDQSREAAESLTAKSEILSQKAGKLSVELGETLNGKVSELADALARGEAHGKTSRKELGKMIAQGQELEKLLKNNALSLADQEQHIGVVQGNFTSFVGQQEASLTSIDATLQAISQHMNSLSQDSKTTLSAAFQDIRDNAEHRLSELEQRLTEMASALAATMGERSEEVLETAMRGKSEEVIGKLQLALNQALGATREASSSLVTQLSKVDALTSNLETRVAQARERAELDSDQEFTRNLALITESLNSASIDITKILSNDVTDTAWAAYLKGDRGVFTRRAVRLLSGGEVREIAQHYEQDLDFQETVNRYIHDFEAMLRDLLSTRNGEAISVTLLSSDMGKLYVALAQAIERFR